MSLTAPVAFIVFNRPEHTAESFARIREQRPSELFVIADGPRDGHPTDAERTAAVREVVSAVDWPCTVHRDYAESNLGCKRRVASGLDWTFSLADRAIVLEDDCIPNDDFFAFCDALLDRYEDDERVAAITGDNFQDGTRRGDGAYYFSKYNHVWGWATWSRSWHHYDVDIDFWPEWKASPQWRAVHADPVERRFWERILDRTYRGEIDTWDYQWAASTWYHGGLTATPNANLVANIGFGADATHTQSPADARPAEPLGDLDHPAAVERHEAADRYTFEHHYGGRSLRWPGAPLAKLRRLVSRGLPGR